MINRTAIIDIGSNSARLVIFEKSSKFGFHIICEQKSRVRIGEGAYSNNGYLQPIGIERAYLALESFVQTINKYNAKETLSIATSALRDAPNGKKFVKWIEKKLGISINIINGNEEAKLGAIATINLLPILDAITIDIGGGSSDISLINNKNIIQTYSLNIGTVRIKELFFDNKNLSKKNATIKAREYIAKELNKLPSNFKEKIAVGIGGTARTLGKGIMKRNQYPLNKLHAFNYKIEDELSYFNEIITSSDNKSLQSLYIKKGRYDTIREGTLIFIEIIKAIEAKEVITGGVGVREGLFLKNMLKKYDYKFPDTVNPSLTNILDRFDVITTNSSKSSHRIKIASKLYNIFYNESNLDKEYQKELYIALELSNIGKTLTLYDAHKHAFYISMQELNFDFTHKEMILISLLLRMDSNSLLNKDLFSKFRSILPKKEKVKYLSFIYTLTVLLHDNSNNAEIEFVYKDDILYIKSNQSLYHSKESIRALEKPHNFDIVFNDKKFETEYNF